MVYTAAEQGHTAVVEALLRLGVDPDGVDGWIATALMGAAQHAHTDAAAALLRGGAAVDAVNEDGETALMWAAWKGEAECVRLLLEAGADASLRATGGLFEGKTALEVAECMGKAEVVALLEARMSVVEKVHWEKRKAEIAAQADRGGFLAFDDY